MADSNDSIACPRCQRRYRRGAVICLACHQAFGEATFLRSLAASYSVAAALVAGLAGGRVVARFSTLEVIAEGTGILAIVYGAQLVLARIRDPQRRVLDEFAAIYSSRGERLMVMLGLIGMELAVRYGFVARAVKPWVLAPWFAQVRTSLFVVVAICGPAAVAVIIWRQGLAFFDPSIRNAMVERESARPDSQPLA